MDMVGGVIVRVVVWVELVVIFVGIFDWYVV